MTTPPAAVPCPHNNVERYRDPEHDPFWLCADCGQAQFVLVLPIAEDAEAALRKRVEELEAALASANVELSAFKAKLDIEGFGDAALSVALDSAWDAGRAAGHKEALASARGATLEAANLVVEEARLLTIEECAKVAEQYEEAGTNTAAIIAAEIRALAARTAG